MRLGIGFLVGLILLAMRGSTLWAGEPPGDVTCAIWNTASEGERLMYAVGYSVGATFAAATAGSRLARDGLAREILMYLLPDNYRFGEIAAEVDTSCSLAATGNKSIMSVLEGIAHEKNAALIYQHENQPYEQFFKK